MSSAEPTVLCRRRLGARETAPRPQLLALVAALLLAVATSMALLAQPPAGTTSAPASGSPAGAPARSPTGALDSTAAGASDESPAAPPDNSPAESPAHSPDNSPVALAAGPPNASPAQAPRSALVATLDVAAPGWIRIPLDAHLLAALGEDDLELHDPQGELVPVALLEAEVAGDSLPVAVAGVTRSAGGWTLLLDLGPQPPTHDRLEVSFPRFAVALGCRLAGSADRSRWHELATADLFRLDDDGATAAEGLARGQLSYPPTTDRWLRLDWPEAAGEPALSGLAARAATAVETTVTLDAAPIPTASAIAGTRFLLPLPGDGRRLEALTITLPTTAAASGTVVRLHLGTPDGWRAVPVSRQRSGPAGDVTVLTFPRGALAGAPGAVARLDLHGYPNEAGVPHLRWQLAAATAVARTSAAGRHQLLVGPRSGVAGQPSRLAAEEPEAGEGTTTVTPAEITPRGLAALPAAPIGPGAALPDTTFAARFTLAADAVPGDVVRLPLTPDLLAQSAAPGTAAADLRLAAGDRQLPYLRQRRANPTLRTLAVGPPGTPPDARDRPAGPATSWWSLPLPARSNLPLHLELASPHGPFARTLTLHAHLAPVMPGGDGWRHLTASSWSCGETPPAPCSFDFTISLIESAPAPGLIGAGSAADTADSEAFLAVALDDGDNPPLPAVAAELWQGEEEILFLWPAGSAPDLLIGASSLTAPRYDLTLLADELVGRPFHLARATRAIDDPVKSKLGGNLALGAIVLAAVALLLLLSRLLPRQRTPPGGG